MVTPPSEMIGGVELKKVNRQSFYWSERIGYDEEKEVDVYQYLCGQLKGRRARKIDESKKFYAYSKWKRYIKNNLDTLDPGELEEFCRFLNYRLRMSAVINHWTAIWLAPLYVSIMSAILVNVKAQEFIDMFFSLSIYMKQVFGLPGFWRIIGILAGLVLALIAIAVIVAIPVIVIGSLVGLGLELKKTNQEKAFYEDVIEIVREVQTERSLSEG